MEDEQAAPKEDKKPEKVSFWKTVPGILTGIAAIVTAVATLLAAADKAGLIGTDDAAGSGDSPDSGAITTHGDGSPVIQGTQGDVVIEDRQ